MNSLLQQKTPHERDVLIETLTRWRLNPVSMVREQFHAEPDPWQAAVLNAFPVKRRICMKACKGPGKSTILSWLILNFLATRPRCKIPATSITKENLRDNLWAEIALWRAKSKFFTAAIEWSKERVFMREDPANWFAVARAWARDANEEQQAQTLAGIHADYVLFIIDEAGGIPDAVAAAAEGGLATGIETKIVLAGNPTHLSGPLYRACTFERRLWYILEITADPDDPKRATRVSKLWAREMIEKYGRDHPWVRSGVLGKFPKSAENALVTADEFQAALDKKPDTKVTFPRILGVDIARYGSNRSVICKRIGYHCPGFIAWHGRDTVKSADNVARCADEFEPNEIRIDDVGVGGGTVDILISRGYQIIPVNNGSAAYEKDKYINLRAETNMAVRERYKHHEISLDKSVRDDTTLVAEGTTLKFLFGGVGARLKIESKEEYINRMRGNSPDFWDAHVLAFGDPFAITGVPV